LLSFWKAALWSGWIIEWWLASTLIDPACYWLLKLWAMGQGHPVDSRSMCSSFCPLFHISVTHNLKISHSHNPFPLPLNLRLPFTVSVVVGGGSVSNCPLVSSITKDVTHKHASLSAVKSTNRTANEICTILLSFISLSRLTRPYIYIRAFVVSNRLSGVNPWTINNLSESKLFLADRNALVFTSRFGKFNSTKVKGFYVLT